MMNGYNVDEVDDFLDELTVDYERLYKENAELKKNADELNSNVGKYKNMAQHTYDEESVQELLGWAKKMLETKSYPTEKYQVNACTSIIDGKLYLESLISMISKNWENPTFHPTIEQLWEYREKWEGQKE